MATTKKTTKKKTKPAATTSQKTGEAGKNADMKFPGYPLYSQEDDIVKRAKRVDQNLEDDTLFVSNVKERKEHNEIALDKEEAEELVVSESDVTKEDLEALGPKDLSMDMGDDEALKHRTRPVDFAGDDLDVPGAELDDDQEKIGSEDEENNLYSQ